MCEPLMCQLGKNVSFQTIFFQGKRSADLLDSLCKQQKEGGKKKCLAKKKKKKKTQCRLHLYVGVKNIMRCKT